MDVSLHFIMAGIYIHIPFCKQACHYCDFHFSTNTEIRDRLIQAMVKEIVFQQHYLENEPIQTIYFGGGTPSILEAEEVNDLLKAIHDHFSVDSHAEVTLEANPDDLTPAKLSTLKEIGINRLSIGIQSFEDTVLKFLNRAHSSSAAIESIGFAREAGFKNISIDLIYAIPGQTEDAWRSNIRQAIGLNPEHISAYSLTIEEKTAFGRWAARGKLRAVEDELSAQQLEILVDDLGKGGYEQYEISNFSKPGFQSQHNSSYWKQHKYLGIGPSAHSYNKLTRQFNVSNNHQYVESIERGVIPFDKEYLSEEDKINEYLMTTLRTRWGSDLDKLKNEFQHDILKRNGDFIQNLINNDLAVVENNFLVLTKTGKLLADKISSDLFLTS